MSDKSAAVLKRKYFRTKHQYYYSLLTNQYRYIIPLHKRVLEIGCSTGELLNELNPSYGVGLDLNSELIESAKTSFPHLHFVCGALDQLQTSEKFDYIILSGTLSEAEDIQRLLESLNRFCHSSTRIIIEYYSYPWLYFLKIAEKLHWKMSQHIKNWITFQDIKNFLILSNLDIVKLEKSTLLPVYIPVISFLLNRFVARLPLFDVLTLNRFIVARPIEKTYPDKSVSIVIPCRNERGNVESCITRTPHFGLEQEFIFVEGNSKDGTYEEIEKVIKKFPNKKIKLLKQKGTGKADAVRLGFQEATGDVLMILDADLTTAPEDLPKFYEAIKSGQGEFINGCRLVYQMEKQAMQFLNLIANKLFGLFFTWLLGQNFRDTLCGTKVISRDHYKELERNRHYFGNFDPFGDFDLIFGAVKLNLKVIEVPIRYRARQYGETQIRRFQHGLLLFRMCWVALYKIKFR